MDKGMVGFAIAFIFMTALSFAMEGTKGTVTTSLTTPLTFDSTTMLVNSTRDFPGTGTLIVEEEIITYTGTTATTFTGLTRGVDDTNAANHLSGKMVRQEALGLLANTLDFRAAQSDVPFFGFAVTGFNIGAMIFKLLLKMALWDYSWFEQNILGIPLAWVQYFCYALSLGLLWRIFVQFRGAG